MNKANFLREVVELEMASTGKGLTETLESLAAWVGVGKSAVWHWWTGTRVPSASARKLLRIRAELPPELREKVENL